MNIKAVLPTRGLIYAKTVQGLLKNIMADDIIIIDGRPMPDCWNVGIKEALESGADYIWMVEEDNELPEYILDAMILEATKGHKIVTLDYPVGGARSHINYINNEPVWCGIGCTLFAREVFERIQYPWFEVDKQLNLSNDTITQIPSELVGKKWAGHDALFFYHKARPLGYKIKVLEGIVGDHYRCADIEKKEINHGQYNVYGLKGKYAR